MVNGVEDEDETMRNPSAFIVLLKEQIIYSTLNVRSFVHSFICSIDRLNVVLAVATSLVLHFDSLQGLIYTKMWISWIETVKIVHEASITIKTFERSGLHFYHWLRINYITLEHSRANKLMTNIKCSFLSNSMHVNLITNFDFRWQHRKSSQFALVSPNKFWFWFH